MRTRTLALIVIFAAGAMAILFGLPKPHRTLPQHLPMVRTTQSDRTSVAMGPYRFDVSGLVEGPGGEENILGVYLVMAHGDVHFQRIGELPLDGAVVPLNVEYLPGARQDAVRLIGDGELVDGLLMVERGKNGVIFYTTDTRDATSSPSIYCRFDALDIKRIRATSSLMGTRDATCRAFFRPRPDLLAAMYVPSSNLKEMALLLPKIYYLTNELIKG